MIISISVHRLQLHALHLSGEFSLMPTFLAERPLPLEDKFVHPSLSRSFVMAATRAGLVSNVERPQLTPAARRTASGTQGL